MKKIILCLFIVAIETVVIAQDTYNNSERGFHVGVGVEALMIGGSACIGGSAMGEYPVGDKGGVTVTAGYLAFPFNKDTILKSPFIVPLTLGGRYYFPGGYFAGLQTGVSLVSIPHYDIDRTLGVGFSCGPSIGMLPNENIDITLNCQVALGEGQGAVFKLGFRAGYSF